MCKLLRKTYCKLQKKNLMLIPLFSKKKLKELSKDFLRANKYLTFHENSLLTSIHLHFLKKLFFLIAAMCLYWLKLYTNSIWISSLTTLEELLSNITSENVNIKDFLIKIIFLFVPILSTQYDSTRNFLWNRLGESGKCLELRPPFVIC